MRIEIIKEKISLDEIKKLAQESFGDMVKVVVDINQGIMAAGGEMHAVPKQCIRWGCFVAFEIVFIRFIHTKT